MKKIRLAAIGCGARTNVYFSLVMKHHNDRFVITALADPIESRRDLIAGFQHGGSVRHFSSAEEFLSEPKMADAVLVATQDNYHFEPALKALEKGYDIILEKPISNSLEEVLVLDRKAEELGVKITSLEELLKNSDFITLHVPLTKQTKGMISKKELQLMKDGAYLINCARGGVVDERALYEALAMKKLAGAALDVFEKEPPVGNPLLNLDNVVVTPHLGASTEEAQRLASMIVCEEVLKVLRNEPPRNVVNMPAIPQEVLDKLRIYFPLAENMGKFAIQIVEGRIKETSITYCGKLKEIDELNVLTNIILCGVLKPILTEGVNILNASLIAKNRGIKITEGKREEAEKFESLIILKMKTDKEELEIKGTLVGKDPIIVGIEDYEVSLYPTGKILIVLHEDKPGMIGKVALTLGKRNVNIASMQVGRKRKGEPQLMVMYVDHRITPQIERDISNIDGVHKVRSLEL